MQLRTSAETTELLKAKVAAAADIYMPRRNEENAHLRYRYANLEAYLDAIRYALRKHGLDLVQAPGPEVLTTRLSHAPSGQWVEFETPIVREQGGKNPAQAYGSGVSYARRYAIGALFGLVQTDDDGEGAFPAAERVAHALVSDLPPGRP